MTYTRLSGQLAVAYAYLLLSRVATAYVFAKMAGRGLRHGLGKHNEQKERGYTAILGPWSLLAARTYLTADCARIAERDRRGSE